MRSALERDHFLDYGLVRSRELRLCFAISAYLAFNDSNMLQRERI